jgi:hypothetical protein
MAPRRVNNLTSKTEARRIKNQMFLLVRAQSTSLKQFEMETNSISFNH